MMKPERIGILHPGEMGISIAVAAQRSGHQVYWASEGRSADTRARAEKFGLEDAQTVERLCAECSMLISVCPPRAAEDVARQVIGCGFTGLYVEANAISPQRSKQIGQAMREAGIDFVDGGIIGGPAWEPGRTWLYLSGPNAEDVAECFSAGPLMTRVLGAEMGRASALKMCYAAYTKGTTALLCAILATAESLGVREALYRQWRMDDEGFAEQVDRRARRATGKAWRFVGEMEEIASTFRSEGMPGDFHEAAASIYRRLAGFKNVDTTPALEEVLEALLKNESEREP